MDPNISLVRYNNNIITYFSTYTTDFRAIRNQIQANTSRYILHDILCRTGIFSQGNTGSTLALFLGTLYMLPASWRSNIERR
jgi:hypothetical protein